MGIIDYLFTINEIAAACGSNTGRVREKNEDNYYFNGSILSSGSDGSKILSGRFELPDDDPRGEFFAVFDGMGGEQYGELASHDAAEFTRKFFTVPGNFNPSDVTPTLTNLCLQINSNVFDSGKRLGVSVMGTTMAALYFYNGMVWSCNVGDSRCYRLRSGRLELLSEDHVERMFEQDPEKRKKKSGLIQFLGMDPEEVRLDPTIVCTVVEDGDVYMICSDGLTDMVSEEDIRAILRNKTKPRDAVEELISTAVANGGRDNITVIVCRQYL